MTLESIQNLLNLSPIQSELVALAATLVLAFITFLILKYIVLHLIAKLILKTKTIWDDKLLDRKFFRNLSMILPILLFYFLADLYPTVKNLIQKISLSLVVFFAFLASSSVLKAINDIYVLSRKFKNRPIKGYLQIVSIIIAIFSFTIILGILIGKSPWILISSLGAMTAVLILVFKDTILSIVASLQITFNDLIEIGDWLSVPQYNADGTVIDIALHVIQIQNWDKTITTIPTHKLINDHFKNWKGMQQSGGRRIKRAINIDLSSIRFCNQAMLKKYEKIELIKDYLKRKKEEIASWNKQKKIDESEIINGRHLTNIGTFRAYVEAYLRSNNNIKQDMTFLVRQLEPTDKGLPIEIYVFSNDTRWSYYETIQADIFDHILAAVPEFDLRIYQSPGSFDLEKMYPKDH